MVSSETSPNAYAGGGYVHHKVTSGNCASGKNSHCNPRIDRREAGALFPKGSRMPAWWGDHKWKLEAWAENSEQGAAPQSCLVGNFIPEEPVGRLCG